MPTKNDKTVESVANAADSFISTAEMHLDDFLNHMEAREHKLESLAAYAALKKRASEYKKTLEAWMQDFRKFEKDIPK